jgi:hypothetical protein
LHLGHYKALLTTYYLETDTERHVDQDLKKIQDELLEASLTIVNMAIKTQTSLTRWKSVDNIIIPKKKDARSLKYFRNIHIYEADWNAIMGIKWKEALKQSEDSNMLQPNQFGSRKQKSTIQPLQLEISQIEISRLSRQQYGQINYDARACYNRILPDIATLASQKYGVYKDLVNLHYKTLTNTKYRVKITGENKTFVFSNSSKTPIYGTGQGSGNSPIIWIFISDTIAQIMETSAIGASYATDDSKKNINLKMTT